MSEAALEKACLGLAAGADRIRSAILRVTLRVPTVRALFRRRVARLGALCALTGAFTLATSLFFPLWVLAIGPAVYGVPHIVASLRYFHYTASPGSRARRSEGRRAFRALAALMAAVAACRLLMPSTGLSEWRGSSYMELVGTLAAFALGAAIYRKGIGGAARGALTLVPLLAGFAFFPAETVGALVLLHNLVAFIYWLLAARSRSERLLAAGAGLALTAITALILAGWLDFVYGGFSPAEELGFAGLSFEALGTMIAPGSAESGDAPLWRHAAVAYAFGQAMHYFVWLKAIPDQHHHSEAPTSFRQSLGLLADDFGRRWAVRVILLTLGSASLWLLLSYPQARWVYFCLAAFHGYFEIAGLALAASGLSLAGRRQRVDDHENRIMVGPLEPQDRRLADARAGGDKRVIQLQRT